MTAQSLGYLGVRAKDLDDWGTYGSNLLGLQRIDKSARIDGVPHGRPQAAHHRRCRRRRRASSFFGWEVADAAALDAVAARLEKAGVTVARGSRALADERRVKDLIVTSDPVGNRLELFHGAETASEPFKPGRNISGFRTGPLGMGHVVMHTAQHRRDGARSTAICSASASPTTTRAVQGDVLARQSAPPQPRA